MATFRVTQPSSLLGVSTDTLWRWADDGRIATLTDASGPHRFVCLLSRGAADELGLEPEMLPVAAVKSTNITVEAPGSRLARPSALIGEARRAG